MELPSCQGAEVVEQPLAYPPIFSYWEVVAKAKEVELHVERQMAGEAGARTKEI
jgi:hypothetical protein